MNNANIYSDERSSGNHEFRSHKRDHHPSRPQQTREPRTVRSNRDPSRGHVVHCRPDRSGKTAFINDIEVFAQGDTATGRTVLVNGEVPAEEFIRDPSKKPIALITQNTKCLADLSVEAFLAMHVRARKMSKPIHCCRYYRTRQPVHRRADPTWLPDHGPLRGPDPFPDGGRRHPDQQRPSHPAR